MVDWVKDKGLAAGQSLSTALANKLFDQYGLTQYLYDPSCDRFEGIYANAVDGWNTAGMLCAVISLYLLWLVGTLLVCYVL